ncbi:Protein phosphatase PTC7-like protein fig [Diplonema papillatum]|nr:Protein phosphatase PTC7-like protein fig [Diplonema papillatum]|eukprot:gene2468-3829_t
MRGASNVIAALVNRRAAAAGRRWMRSPGKVAQSMFLEMDGNKDGVVTMQDVEGYLQLNPSVSNTACDVQLAKRLKGSTVRPAKARNALRFEDVGAAVKNNTAGTSDDAFFISAQTNTAGIADGIGGWKKYGVDAGLYAQALMQKTRDLLESGAMSTWAAPLQLLEVAYQQTRVAGSATVCLVALRGTALQVCNVGDCQLCLFRDGRLLLRSDVLKHSAGKPYQIAVNCGDVPGDADLFSFPARDGDVVLLGSDGLFNNVTEQYLAELTAHPRRTPIYSAQAVAEDIVDAAHANSVLPSGDPDDITCVILRLGTDVKSTT